MDSNIVSMLGNLSRSLASVQALLSAAGYILGILFVITAIMKFKNNAEAGNNGQEGMYGALVYLGVGTGLIFLPSMISVLTNTAFGRGNVLQYITYNPFDVYASMGILIQTAGIMWFVRGCTLVVQGGNSGASMAGKGLAFIGAGILAMNFQYCYGILNYIVSQLLILTGMTG